MAQRHLEGFCFNCTEKFSKDHAKICSGKGIYLLDIGTDDATSDSDPDEEPRVSVNAITGILDNSTLQLATKIQETADIALVDSGSTHCFIASSIARRLGLAISPRPGLTVGVANGDQG